MYLTLQNLIAVFPSGVEVAKKYQLLARALGKGVLQSPEPISPLDNILMIHTNQAYGTVRACALILSCFQHSIPFHRSIPSFQSTESRPPPPPGRPPLRVVTSDHTRARMKGGGAAGAGLGTRLYNNWNGSRMCG